MKKVVETAKQVADKTAYVAKGGFSILLALLYLVAPIAVVILIVWFLSS